MTTDISFIKEGSKVRYWPGLRADDLPARGTATVISDGVVEFAGTPCFRIRKDNGGTDYIATTHVERVPDICDVCEVDHATTHADLSHGKIYLLMHAYERFDWSEWPISGDHLALQRAGTLPPALLFSTDWQQLGERDIRDVGDEDPMRRPPTDCATCDGGGCGDCA